MRTWNKIQDIFDWISVCLGVLAILCIVWPTASDCFQCVRNSVCMVAGIWGCFYIFIYIISLRFWRRVDYDWRLVHGKSLQQVIGVVILVPFVVGLCFHCCIKDLQTLFLQNESGSTMSLFYQVFYLFLDPGNQHAVIKEGMTMAALLALLGVVLLNGLLVSTIVNAFDRRKEQWLNGDIRYSKGQLSNFAVVIGANEVAPSVICNLLAKPKVGSINNKCEADNRYVILQTNRDAQQVREELLSHLLEEDLQRVIIYKALRNSEYELRKMHLEACTEIYVLGESTMGQNGETYHDAMNMRCVNLIASLLPNKKEPQKEQENEDGKGGIFGKVFRRLLTCKAYHRKVCKVMFEYQTTYSIFQFSDISKKVKDTLIFIPFNRYDSWARRVMVEGYAYSDCKHNEEKEKITYTPLDGDGIHSDSDEHVQLVIVGMSKMGIAMGVQAMLQAHYVNCAKAEQDNDTEKKNRTRTRITFVDTYADKERDFFMGRYKNLFDLTRHRYVDASHYQGEKNTLDDTTLPQWIDPMLLSDKWHHLSTHGENFIDLEIEFIKGELESEGVRKYLSYISNNENEYVKQSKLTLAICLTQTHQAIAASLYMPISVYEKAQNIWVYQRESADIILNFKDTPDKRYQKLRPFGMLYSEYMSDRLLYLKSLLVHGAYDEKNLLGIDIADKDTYKDLRTSWKDLRIDQTFSNKYFVDSIPQKLRSILSNPIQWANVADALKENEEVLACCEHNRWNVQQLILGYSPCNKITDKEFCDLNALRKSEDDNIRQKAKTLFKTKKDEECKKGEYRIHPNICDYKHLNEVDFYIEKGKDNKKEEKGAKPYDKKLNKAIPEFIKLVNLHPTLAKSVWLPIWLDFYTNNHKDSKYSQS